MSDRELGEVKVLLTEHVREQREWKKSQDEVNNRILYFIEGNGQPGAKVRLDRLEQASNRGRWWIRIIALPVVGLVVTKVWAAFGG